MFEYLKFLPLLQVLAKHPGLVNRLLTQMPEMMVLANKLEAMIQPSLPEIQQAIAEVEAILQQIYSSRRSATNADKTKPVNGRRKRRRRHARR